MGKPDQYVILDPENGDAAYSITDGCELWLSRKPIENSTNDISDTAVRIPMTNALITHEEGIRNVIDALIGTGLISAACQYLYTPTNINNIIHFIVSREQNK
jgi:hypothetical protein